MLEREKETITSPQNPKIKEVMALSCKPGERSAKKLFTVEGIREVVACLRGGFAPVTIFLCPPLVEKADSKELMALIAPLAEKVFEVSDKVYARMAYRGGTEGVIAVIQHQDKTLKEAAKKISTKNTPLILVAEGVEKPGNIGALLRSSDACGADMFILCDSPTDLYNPNLIRASLGGLFTQNVAVCSSAEAIAYLKKSNIAIYTAQLQDSIPYYRANMRIPCAIVVGSEAKGLTQIWREASDDKIMIPMLGELDSLNVSTSAAILCYEAIRQRIKGNG